MTAADAATAIAAAIGEPARSRMLFCLMDGRPRTSTELALVAGVSPSTASAHLGRLKAEDLVRVDARGRRRYYTLRGSDVAAVLEQMCLLSGRSSFGTKATRARTELHVARACYDHLAGVVGVAVHDRFFELGWIGTASSSSGETGVGGHSYSLTPVGETSLVAAGIDVDRARAWRRRFAYGCIDWTERRPHVAGALGAVVLEHLLERRWLKRNHIGRGLEVTLLGHRGLQTWIGLRVPVAEPEVRNEPSDHRLAIGTAKQPSAG